MRIKQIFISSIIAILYVFSFGNAQANETVVDIAVGSDVHKTLVAAVIAADLDTTLSSQGPFTVFAPIDSAFSKLPEGTVEMLLKPENIDILRSILTYHVIPGKVSSTALSSGLTAQTLQGKEVSFTHVNDTWYINTAKIIATDIVAENGVVHVIDGVILPPIKKSEAFDTIYEIRGILDENTEEKVDAFLLKYAAIVEKLSEAQKRYFQNVFMIYIDEYVKKYNSKINKVAMLQLVKMEIYANNLETNDIVDTAISSGVHKTLVTAVVEADLANALRADGPFTIFAPVDNAFANLPEGTLDSLLKQESKEDLVNILTYHVVPGAYESSDIFDGLQLKTLQGKTLNFSIVGGNVYINNMPTLIQTDIHTSNGIIHIIGDVLLP